MGEEGAGHDIQAVLRVAQLLGLFSPQRPTLTAASAAKLTGLNRSTASRYLASLESAGLLRRNLESPSAFEPSNGLIQLGAFALRQTPVTSAAPPVMRRLTRQTGHTVTLSVWGASGPVVVHVETSVDWGPSVNIRIGTHLDLNAAQTRIWLAFMDRQLAEQSLERAEPADQAEARADIDRIRSGSMHQRVVNNGVTVFAAPILDPRGICASLGLLGVTSELPIEDSEPEATALLSAAEELTNLLGGTWRPARL